MSDPLAKKENILNLEKANDLFDLEQFYKKYKLRIEKENQSFQIEYEFTELDKKILKGILLNVPFLEIAKTINVSKAHIKDTCSDSLYRKIKFFFNITASKSKHFKNRIIPLLGEYFPVNPLNSHKIYNLNEELNRRVFLISDFISNEEYRNKIAPIDSKACVTSLENGAIVRLENLNKIDDILKGICGGCGKNVNKYQVLKDFFDLLLDKQLNSSKESHLPRISKIAVARNILGDDRLLLQLKNDFYMKNLDFILKPKGIFQMEASIRTLKSLSEVDDKGLISNQLLELSNSLDSNYPRKEERRTQALKCRACRAIARNDEFAEEYLNDYQEAVDGTENHKIKRIHIRSLKIFQLMNNIKDFLFDSSELLGNTKIKKEVTKIINLDDEYKIRQFEKELFIFLKAAINPDAENLTRLINANSQLDLRPKKNHCSFDILKLKYATNKLLRNNVSKLPDFNLNYI